LNTSILKTGGLTVLLLLALRVAIGWHFLHEGWDHLHDKTWSSKGFLSGAVGPLAPTAKSYLPDFHGWDRLVNVPFTEREYEIANAYYNDRLDTLTLGKSEKAPPKKPAADLKIDDVSHPLYANPIYGTWAKQVLQDWRGRTEQVANFYHLPRVAERRKNEAPTIEAKSDALKAEPAAPVETAKTPREMLHDELLASLKILHSKLQDLEKDLFEHRAELMWFEKAKVSPEANIPYQEKRLADKKKELSGKPNAWAAELQGLDKLLLANQIAAIPADQRGTAEYQVPEPQYKQLDDIVKWVLVIGGACLIIGFFTRLAAWTCGLFLLGIVLLQPFWIPGAAATFNQIVEMLACFVLGTTNIGRIAGLDFLTHVIFGRSEPAPMPANIVVTKRPAAKTVVIK
jgi:uncharacterized membrane protein YphA (DoxX/SURF4 family)